MMGLRSLAILFLLTCSGFGLEVGAKIGVGLPVGGLETYHGSGLSGTVYGTVVEKINLELGYTILSGKSQGYQLSISGLDLALGYPIIKQTNSTIGVVAGVGVSILERSIGEARESGQALNINLGGRFVQKREGIGFNLDLLAALLTDGKGWGTVLGIRFGVGYEI